MSVVVNERDKLLQAAASRLAGVSLQTNVTVNTANLGDGAVTTPKVADAAVTTAKMADGAVTTSKIVDAAISAAKFALGIEPVSIVSSLPAAAGYTGPKTVLLTSDNKLYRYDSVTPAWTVAVPAVDITGQLADSQIAALAASKVTGQLTDSQLAAIAAAKVTGQLVESQLADGAVSAIKFATGIQPVSVVSSLPAASGYTGPRTVFLTSDNKLYRYDSVTPAWTVAVPTTDLSGQITETQITDSAISTPKLAAGAVTTAKLTAGAVTANEIATDAVTAGKIAAGSVTTAKLAAGAVTATEIAADAVTAAKILAGSVTTAKLAAGAVTATEIAAGAVIADKIAADAVTSAKIYAGAVTTAKLAAGAVTATEIASGAVTTIKLAAGAVTANEIAAGAVTSDKVTAGAITTAKLAASAVTANELAADAVTAAKILAGAVTADKVAANSITASKLVLQDQTSAIPDPHFYDREWWNYPSDAYHAPSESGEWPIRRTLQVKTGAGVVQFSSDNFLIELGASYRLKVWVWLSSDFAGKMSPCVHFPGQSHVHFGMPTVSDANFPGGVRFDTANATKGTWLSYETIFTNSASLLSTTNPNTVAQVVLRHELTGGYFHVGFEITRAANAKLIVDGSIVAGKMAADSITAENGAIKNLAVTSAKIADLAVTTLKIAGEAVTIPRSVEDAGTYQTNSLTAGQDVTIATLPTFTSAGGNVVLHAGARVRCNDTTGGSVDLIFKVKRDGTEIFTSGTLKFTSLAAGEIRIAPLIPVVDAPGAVSVSYTLTFQYANATTNFVIEYGVIASLETKR